MTPSPEDIRALVRDKYDGDETADLSADFERLAAGEPLAYVIGWIPFLGLRISLDSRPLIPRTETEYWVEQLIAHLNERFGDRPFRLLDLCAGSGAIGLAVMKSFPHAEVVFAEIDPAHKAQIEENARLNELPAPEVRSGDLFAPLEGEQFDVIATNPPYVPEGRALEKSVIDYEPSTALFAGSDGLALIKRIAAEAPAHLSKDGELWIECDSEHADAVLELLPTWAAIHEDQYGRPRYVVSYYP